ncbi:MAG: hypothetical protein IPH76_13450 [Xanthomonadales bacterium]|nr:hypothetical protein [Xanthomonadales bacterium]
MDADSVDGAIATTGPAYTAAAAAPANRTGAAKASTAWLPAAAAPRRRDTFPRSSEPARINASLAKLHETPAATVARVSEALARGDEDMDEAALVASLERAAMLGEARAMRLLAEFGQLTAQDQAQADAFEDLYLSQYLTAWRMGDPEGLRRLQQNLPANATRVEVLSWLRGSDLHLRRIDEARAARGLPRLVLPAPPPAAPR